MLKKVVGAFLDRKTWFALVDYKRYENEVGRKETTKPQDVYKKIKQFYYRDLKEWKMRKDI